MTYEVTDRIERMILAEVLKLNGRTHAEMARMLGFTRRTLYNKPRPKLDSNTFWREAEGYDLDEERLTQQS